MKYLERAYRVDKNNPMVLNHLANHFFYRNDLQKVRSLALNAYHKSNVPEIKGESCYYMARAHHAVVSD